jgi:ribose 5-phosphate isomerase A
VTVWLQDPARAAVAHAVAARVGPGMTIGLGSGRAVFSIIELLGRRSLAPPVRAAVGSAQTASLAAAAGIELVELDGKVAPEFAIDGADEVDQELNLLKGGGGALLREKLIASAAASVVIAAEARKLVARLGTVFPLPVEVVRYAWPDTRRRLLDLVPAAVPRVDAAGSPVVTEEGHVLLDCAIPPGDLVALAAALKATVGVVEHGLFLGVTHEVLLGASDGSVRTLTRSQPLPGPE